MSPRSRNVTGVVPRRPSPLLYDLSSELGISSELGSRHEGKKETVKGSIFGIDEWFYWGGLRVPTRLSDHKNPL